jgi:hypothetical protein
MRGVTYAATSAGGCVTIEPIFLMLLWRRQLYGARRFYAISN